ncbi:secretory carrier-associated membrane protein 4 [Sigmodon hispidus]
MECGGLGEAWHSCWRPSGVPFCLGAKSAALGFFGISVGAAVVMLIPAILFSLSALMMAVTLVKVHRIYCGAGGSLQKAQTEWNAGTWRNPPNFSGNSLPEYPTVPSYPTAGWPPIPWLCLLPLPLILKPEHCLEVPGALSKHCPAAIVHCHPTRARLLRGQQLPPPACPRSDLEVSRILSRQIHSAGAALPPGSSLSVWEERDGGSYMAGYSPPTKDRRPLVYWEQSQGRICALERTLLPLSLLGAIVALPREPD